MYESYLQTGIISSMLFEPKPHSCTLNECTIRLIQVVIYTWTYVYERERIHCWYLSGWISSYAEIFRWCLLNWDFEWSLCVLIADCWNSRLRGVRHEQVSITTNKRWKSFFLMPFPFCIHSFIHFSNLIVERVFPRVLCLLFDKKKWKECKIANMNCISWIGGGDESASRAHFSFQFFFLFSEHISVMRWPFWWPMLFFDES